MVSEKFKQVFDWLFRDDKGTIVIAQAPNWPLQLVVGFYLLKFVQIDGLISFSVWGGRISLLYWAYLEITQGVNGFRKLLGVTVLVWMSIQVLL